MLRRALFLCICIPLLASLPRTAGAVCPAGFTENWDEVACCALGDAQWITEQIPLPLGSGTFMKDFLADFSAEALLPVSNGGERELWWTNGVGDRNDLALTPNSDEGNYDHCRVSMEGVFAVVGDIEGALPKAGVVVRHTGLPFPAPRKFYSAYASIANEGGKRKIRLHLEKWIGVGFESLDLGPPASDAFPFEEQENFRIGIDVSERGGDGNSQLTGWLDRVSVVGGVLQYERLVDLTGLDNDLDLGQIGLYVEGASANTEIAWDENIAIASGVTPARRATWGSLKARYR